MSNDPVKSTHIVLYAYATSPDAAKVNCFLDYKELEFNIIHVDPIFRRQIRFSSQGRVPLLEIGGEWRTDPTEIGIWLEERFPQRPILGQTSSERAMILRMNQWVTGSLTPVLFLEMAEGENFSRWLQNGWCLAAVLHRTRRLPLSLRWLWPMVLRMRPFIKRLNTDRNPAESLVARQERVCHEMRQWLGKGPYLGECREPSLADLAAYPQFIMPYLLGLEQDYVFFRVPEVLGWMSRVQQWLPANPLLAPEDCLKRGLPYSAR